MHKKIYLFFYGTCAHHWCHAAFFFFLGGELFGKGENMRKKVLSAVLAATMVAGMMGNVVSVSAEEKYDLTLYSVNTTDPDFDD